MAMKAQLNRLMQAFPGSPVDIHRSVNNFGGKINSEMTAYAANATVKQGFGKTGHEAVNNLIAANRSTSAEGSIAS